MNRYLLILLTFASTVFPLTSNAGLQLVCKGHPPERHHTAVNVDCSNRKAFIDKLGSAWQTLRENAIGGSLDDMCWKAFNEAKGLHPSISFENVSDAFLARCNLGLAYIESKPAPTQSNQVLTSNTNPMTTQPRITKGENNPPQAPPIITANASTNISTPRNECDELAGSPLDPERVTVGVTWDSLDPVRAVKACKAAVTATPRSGRAWFQYGRSLEKSNQMPDAIDAYRRATELNHAAALNNLGELYRDAKGVSRDLSRAEDLFSRAAKLGSSEGAANLQSLRKLNSSKATSISQTPGSSLLQAVLEKRWSIDKLPCNTNGGAYDTFTRDRGVVFTAGGKEQSGEARTRYEYLDQGPLSFTYKQQFLANDMVARLIGDANAISASIETVYTKVSPSEISYTKKIAQLNFDALMKGEKKYDRIVESGTKTLCSGL